MNDPAENLCLSETLELARRQIVTARRTLEDAVRKHGWKDRISHVEGLLTCGLVTLAHSKEEVVKFEIATLDKERGPHLKFNPRGIGLDVCPCCFVCMATKRAEGKNNYLHNIAAFVESKPDGEKIVEWFTSLARLDYREREPNWIQLKVGACDLHLSNLKELERLTSKYGVIRQKDIEESLNTPSQIINHKS